MRLVCALKYVYFVCVCRGCEESEEFTALQRLARVCQAEKSQVSRAKQLNRMCVCSLNSLVCMYVRMYVCAALALLVWGGGGWEG